VKSLILEKALAINGVARAADGMLVVAVCYCVLTIAARAQQQLPEDSEDDKRLGLWLDQGLSAGLWTNKSLEVEIHERFDEVTRSGSKFQFETSG
jgi:hypothetical protein